MNAIDINHELPRQPLWADIAPAGNGTSSAGNAFITVHLPKNPNGTCVVICPGGAYWRVVVEPEGHGIARWLNEHGITGIVLEYRLPCGNPLVPLLDAQRAIRVARSKTEEWKCDSQRVGILGFSAGGHLASMAATQFDNGNPEAPDVIDRLSSRPDFAILIYPVIVTVGPSAHVDSRNNLLGKNATPERIESFSSEKRVTSQTPPVFLAHAQDDTAVTPENSQLFYDALIAHQIPATYLKLPTGGHGLDGYQGPMWDEWQAESLKWLAARGFAPRAQTGADLD